MGRDFLRMIGVGGRLGPASADTRAAAGPRSDRRPLRRRHEVFACRTIPIPLFALYSVVAAGVTWLIAMWHDRMEARKLREQAKEQQEEQV